MSEVLVNAVGDACPIPVVKATQALKQLQKPARWRCRWITKLLSRICCVWPSPTTCLPPVRSWVKNFFREDDRFRPRAYG